MNKIMMALGVAGLVAFGSAQAMAGECSVATLKGHYTYWLQGVGADGKGFAEVGQEHYDGAGKVVNNAAVAGTSKIETTAGTYTVNDDCSGTATYESGGTYNFFVAPSGDSFVFTSSKEGTIEAGENTRVAND